MANKTVEEVKKERVRIESQILKMLQDFEKEYNVFTGYIDTERKISKKERQQSNMPYIPEPERNGPLVNITINLRFDI